MSHHSDPSHEMYSEELSPDDVEALLTSGFGAPADAGLHQAFGELRALPDHAATPAPSAQLSAFLDVHLTPSPEPTVDLAAPVVDLDASTPVHNVRRLPMIGQFAAFLGTLGGKICVGTTVAAASFGGAAATGAVDVPFFEEEPAQVETIELEEPDAVAFVDEEPVEESEVAEDVEPEPEKTLVEAPEPEADEAPEDDVAEEEEDPESEEAALEEEPVEEEKPEEPAPAAEPEKVEEPAEKDEEKKNDEGEKKDEEPKDEEKEKDESSEKTPEQEAIQEQIAALDEALHIAKDAVRAEATELITPLELTRKNLVAALEADLEEIAAEWEPVVADLEEQLEAAETDEEYLAIQADLEAAQAAWEEAHIAAELDADPAIEEIDAELERIELERDAELNRLIAEFLAAVEALEKG